MQVHQELVEPLPGEPVPTVADPHETLPRKPLVQEVSRGLEAVPGRLPALEHVALGQLVPSPV